jgi:hypothetical protein
MTITVLIVVLFTIVVMGLLLYSKTNAVAVAMGQRLDIEKQVVESIKRVENVLAGAGGKGSAGENIVELAFSNFLPDWQVRNFVVNNKTVEFGVRLPDNLVLPIDSKFVATDLLEQFLACEDPEQKRKLKGKIHAQTERRAVEISKVPGRQCHHIIWTGGRARSLFAVCSEIIATLS